MPRRRSGGPRRDRDARLWGHAFVRRQETVDTRKAERVLRALLRAEPDFLPASVLTDGYPAITLRRSGLAERHLAAMTAICDRLRQTV